MSIDNPPRRARARKPYTVVMRSRDNQRVLVRDPLDVQFLELADAFQMKARAIIEEAPEDRRPENAAR
ncbi:hypothetical protein CFK39_08860 [Brachybacterium avium]|uniref:Uncharacterized protein n=1 Tax=Brachybacterium avium TaxID=2017485 RepID=A0A220UCP6_9MICO|nr:hypothetical protein CFK39_08860 [Brachybacterium avium]